MLQTEIRKSAVSFDGEARFHLGLNVADLERAVLFYSQVFDQEPTKIRPGYAKFEVAQPSVNFTLNERKGAGSPERKSGNTLSHLGIQLKDTGALATVRERLETAGLVRRVEEGTDCCYAHQDKFWLRDPDGNELEFFVVLERDSIPAEAGSCCT